MGTIAKLKSKVGALEKKSQKQQKINYSISNINTNSISNAKTYSLLVDNFIHKQSIIGLTEA